MAYKVNKGICIGCGACVDTCPEGAIYISEEDDLAEIDPEKCARCGLCASMCPQEAIEEVDE
ncbi:MAG: 4Fe-4S binding protein [Firmicutes bacterium]|jgi:ferredoxin|nr:4Fe-4S binding protein [Bacillota bacterium]